MPTKGYSYYDYCECGSILGEHTENLVCQEFRPTGKRVGLVAMVEHAEANMRADREASDLELAIEFAETILRCHHSGDCVSDGMLAMARTVIRLGKTARKTVPQPARVQPLYRALSIKKGGNSDS